MFAVNPMSVSRYRDRHSASGAKSDPGDAKVLADLVRTDRHNHRPVAGDSDLAEAVKVLARAHQSMIWSRRRQANMLRSALREFYPAALAAFDDLTSGDAVEVLRAAPAPAPGAALSRPKIAAARRRGGRQRRIDARVAQIQAALRAPQLAPAPVIATAMGASVSASVAVIAEMTTQITVLPVTPTMPPVRALGNCPVGILHAALPTTPPYSETTAWAHRASTCLTTPLDTLEPWDV